MEFFAEMLKATPLSRSALKVAFALLYRHLNGHSGRCDPSIPTLANETGLTIRSVNSAIDELRRSGWWRISREGSPGRGGRTNAYAPKLEVVKQISLPWIASAEASDTSSKLEVVKRTTPVRAESGEARCQKVVKRASPKPVKNQESLDLGLPTGSSNITDGANDDFETFWSVYPSRHPHSNPKKPARLKFETAIKRGADPADIIRRARHYAACVAANVGDPRYIAQAQTWLNQERWNDYQEAPEPPRLRVGMN
jgi:hypothetical protein